MAGGVRWQPSVRWRRALPTLTALAACVPLGALATRFFTDDLGANPIEEITHATGDWTLRLLLLSLAVTPARRLLRFPALAPLRRTLGLAAFGYASLHLLTYVALDQGFAWALLLEDVSERRYVTAGFAAFLCLVPLAVTSTRRAQKRLGPKWQRLHRLVYPAAILAVIHYLWLVKADLLPPLAYASVLAVLLALRLRGRRGVGC
jgi:sulfoxide reductase heme-binding subunit YedZ